MYSIVMSASVFVYQTRLKCAPNAMLELFLSIAMLVIQRNLVKNELFIFPIAVGVSTQSNIQTSSANHKSSAEPTVTQNVIPASETQGR